MTPDQLLQTIPTKINSILKTLDEPNISSFGNLQINFEEPTKYIAVKDEVTGESHVLTFTGDIDDAKDFMFLNPGYPPMPESLNGFVHFEKLVYTELEKVQNYLLDTLKNKKTTGFFRHVRPLVYDSKLQMMQKLPDGGVSFYLEPIQDRTYNFWVYACPQDIPFSARQAVSSLRSISKDATPWGNIELSGDESIVVKIEKAMKDSELPSEIPKMLSNILENNKIEIAKQPNQESVE